MSERIFTYNYRIFDHHKKPVASLVVLADDRPGWRPNHFGYALWGCKVGITFPVVKLTDYQSNWAELERNRNPFAIAVMAHLKTRETRGEPENRRMWKMHLTKRLYTIGYQKQDVLNLFHFIDWMMRLPEAAEKTFWEEMQSFEEEKKMKYISSVERIGVQKGRIEGKIEGRKEGRMALIQKLLNKRFGGLSPDLQKKLQTSELEILDRFGESILDFKDLKDAENWWERQGKEGNA